jgi:fluoride exporter
MQALAHVGWVFLGGGIGSALRYGVGRASLAWLGPNFPAGTLVVNVLGCALMGVLAEWLALRDTGGANLALRHFLATGILGGFTTFSAFALDTSVLWQRGDSLATALYVFASVMLSIVGLLAGMAMARAALAG